MLFSSREYLWFLTAVFSLYWLLPWNRGRVWLLLAASFTFYACWNSWLAVIVCGSTLFDWLLARRMDSGISQGQRKGLLIVSLGMNLGLLCYFKYVNFFLDSLRQSLQLIGATASMPVLEVILPIGISFYTFEAINYTVDVYRRRISAEANLANFMLFVLFFPHLVAGPIVRARDFLPQILRPKVWNWSRIHLGLWLLAIGLFKKCVIADRMALIVDPVFAHPELYDTWALWTGMVAFALQVYCDFSGYTDMALGSAHLLGYRLTVNFNLPFLAVNVADFWKRWHISLSTWLRDYLFIPLGGSRSGEFCTQRNLLITMSLGGLWHGANWNYVLWGVLQGVLLCGHRCFTLRLGRWWLLKNLLESSLGTVARIAVTFLTFCLSLAVFRTLSLHDTGVMFSRLFSGCDSKPSPLATHSFLLTVLMVFTAHVVASRTRWLVWMRRVPALLQAGTIAGIFTLALLLAPGASRAFIYFQF